MKIAKTNLMISLIIALTFEKCKGIQETNVQFN